MFSLVVTACGSASSQAAQGATSTIDVALSDFMIMPHSFDTKAGTVTFHVHNDGESLHNFYIRDDKNDVLAKTADLDPKKEEDLKATLKAGTYTIYCEEPGHESLGMKGTLAVS
jgi:uncharacterized cupredoxin-like copper-binding protein